MPTVNTLKNSIMNTKNQKTILAGVIGTAVMTAVMMVAPMRWVVSVDTLYSEWQYLEQ